VAAALTRELAIPVTLEEGRYGEFTVLVDGEVVARAGALAAFGVLPTRSHVLARVRERLARSNA
jgi:hypothetical protein